MEPGALPAFDEHHPPEQALVDECVHCGFCLPSCPTYVLFGEEMDSPRGRIHLMRQGLEGEPLTDAMAGHFDLCLGCLACVTACPSGVRYDRLIEATRQQVERRHRRPAGERALRSLVFALFPYPARLRVAVAPLRVAQRTGLHGALRRSTLLARLPAALRSLEALAPRVPPYRPTEPLLEARGQRRLSVGLLTGCVQSVLFPQVNAATARVLAAEGCEVRAPHGGCCGALSLHAGREAEAQRFARATIDAFEAAGVERIVVNAAGCGSALKEYGELLRDDPRYAQRAAAFSARVRDASELLTELAPVAERRPLPLVVAYHDACHLAHGQRIRAQPRALLRSVPGLELRELRDGDLCCGSAGIYNLVQPAPAAELGERKARAVLESGAELVVTANPGCLLQLGASLRRLGRELPLAHPLELLDASLRGEQPAALLAR
jgi:glycolate oxidase iron-sulfur subunit